MALPLGTLALGGGWLALHTPDSCRSAALRALDLGFDALVPAPTAKRFPWQTLRAEIEDLPIGVPAIRVDPPFETKSGSLASSRADDVLAARARFERAAELAARLGVATLIFEAPSLGLPLSSETREELEAALTVGREPDTELFERAAAAVEARRDAGLEHACRHLHGLLRQFPDLHVCLTESPDLGSLSGFTAIEAMLDDLAGLRRLHYWHQAAIVSWQAASGGPATGHVLENLSKYLRGMDLADYGEHGYRSVPGSGLVDYRLLAPYTGPAGSRHSCCLELDPACRVDEVKQGRAFLGKFGL
ncbi:MAG: hypothetical protein H6832_03810 [Planctomycetes bacterium]|nr:hypothetical protein [Planctomycetota bacterium]